MNTAWWITEKQFLQAVVAALRRNQLGFPLTVTVEDLAHRIEHLVELGLADQNHVMAVRDDHVDVGLEEIGAVANEDAFGPGVGVDHEPRVDDGGLPFLNERCLRADAELGIDMPHADAHTLMIASRAHAWAKYLCKNVDEYANYAQKLSWCSSKAAATLDAKDRSWNHRSEFASEKVCNVCKASSHGAPWMRAQSEERANHVEVSRASRTNSCSSPHRTG